MLKEQTTIIKILIMLAIQLSEEDEVNASKKGKRKKKENYPRYTFGLLLIRLIYMLA